MSEKRILVLGAGPGGYAAAFLAADLGMKVTLVDAGNQPGGVCLHRGCIPSKTLLHMAHLIHEAREAKAWGLDFGEPRLDLEAIRKWKNQVIGKMASGLVQLCRQRGVEFVQGRGVFKDSQTVEVSGKGRFQYDHCILAVGSSPAIPAEFKKLDLLDSTRALELEDIPRRLLIVGGGYIGLEMGTVYARLGSRVTVVEMMEGLLTGVDRDLVRPLQQGREFESILLRTKVTRIKRENGAIQVVLENDLKKDEQTFDQVLVSVGRVPNTGELGLESTKVELDARGFVKTDNRQRTADSAILAIGDVIGGAMLAHKASHEARVAVGVLAGEESVFDNRIIPAVVFTDPEIAWCGLTETEAKAQNKEVCIAKFPWGASGRYQILGRSDGMTKLVIDPESERVLGVGLVGAGAGELIAEGVLAVEMGAVARDLASSIHPHPTLSETLMEAAEVFFGTATHLYKKKKP